MPFYKHSVELCLDVQIVASVLLRELGNRHFPIHLDNASMESDWNAFDWPNDMSGMSFVCLQWRLLIRGLAVGILG